MKCLCAYLRYCDSNNVQIRKGKHLAGPKTYALEARDKRLSDLNALENDYSFASCIPKEANKQKTNLDIIASVTLFFIMICLFFDWWLFDECIAEKATYRSYHLWINIFLNKIIIYNDRVAYDPSCDLICLFYNILDTTSNHYLFSISFR